MESKTFIAINICFLLVILLPVKCSSSAKQPLCHEHEKDTLLKLKQSFLISKQAGNVCGYPKLQSWNLRSREGRDCCSWDGVQCNKSTGYIIGLDISNSCLYGAINSSSSLFQLVHLQRLNLASNNFSYLEIPSAIWRLSRLTHLNLSYSSFSGQIPQQVLQLSQLVSLDISGNPSTMLRNPDLGTLVEKLAYLQILHLNDVNISSTIPDVLANKTSLTSLYLQGCNLHGEFPGGIFYLPNLQNLSIMSNPNITGTLPESIGNLNSLTILDISYCGFSGSVPASMENLRNLTYLSISNNNFTSQILPSWLGKLSELKVLQLYRVNFKGEIPSFLANLTKLSYICLRANQLTGRIPPWLGNLTQLTYLDLTQNQLNGQVPDSIFRLLNLEHIYLDGNNLTGTLQMDKFLKLRNLTHLDLSANSFSVLSNTNVSEDTIPKMKAVGLASCNLSMFPYFLQNQTELEWLDLSVNNITGQIPRWIWSIGKETLMLLILDFNFLSGFEEHRLFFPWKQLQILSLRSNRIEGSLPIPPPSTSIYQVGNNSFTGKLPQGLCSLTLLKLLDVSDNNLSGIIPPCFGNFSNNLLGLNLKGNKFQGTIPQTFRSGGQLRDINLSRNQLRGRLSRSLANCSSLEIFDVSNNRINDSFPNWLGTLANLTIVNLRSNRFHGNVTGFKKAEVFSKLRIIDISQNSFSGNLPAEHLRHWDAMKASNRSNTTYMVTRFNLQTLGIEYAMPYTTGMTYKGVEMENRNILDTLAVIDFSGNKFKGGIPKVTANLKGLHLLNLSCNYLTGPIPPALANLTALESLDLSHNNLSGQIPVQLAGLTSLAIFNASYNNLAGIIPHGYQFDTFQENSYLGNPKLCGYPSPQQCNRIQTSPAFPKALEEAVNKKSTDEIDWVVVSMGYASGLVIGAAIGWVFTSDKHEWFVETFGIRRKQKSSRRR